MSVPAAFLIASGSANGKADATFEVTVMLAATTAIERQSVPLDIDISPFFFAYGSHDARKLRRHREYAASVPAYLTAPTAALTASDQQLPAEPSETPLRPSGKASIGRSRPRSTSV